MTITSENPAATSGKLRASKPSFTYPLNEAMSSMTRLRFVKYDRFNPWDTAGEEGTATITLPLPITVPETYSFNTTHMDLGMYGNINNTNLDALKNFGGGNGSIQDKLKAFTDSGVSALTDIVKSKNFSIAAALAGVGLLTGGTDMDVISAFTGITQNPHTTIVFNGVNLRAINLEWRLSPRSEDESRVLKNIYDTIKLRAHPEELNSGFALNYPDLVYIEFDGKIAEWMPKFQKAFVTNISIVPDSSNGMTLYKSGAPAVYNFQLSAIELSILTRNRLDAQINGEPVTTAPTVPTIPPDDGSVVV